MRLIALLVPLMLAISGTGCGPSVWERSFSYEPGMGPGAPAESVVVREAPWERVSAAIAAEREAVASSDLHREDWSPGQARAVETALLGSLQLPVAPEDAELIGRSQFKTTSGAEPASPELARFARSIGAEYVVWTRRLLGKAETVEHEPVWRDRWWYERYWDADRKRFVYIRRWEPETVWVPVVVERDEVWYVVFYVRRGA